MAKALTVEQLQKALPSRKNTITQELVDVINEVGKEPEFQGESLLTVMLTHQGAMEKHRASMQDYIYALRFCAYLITEEDNIVNAYRRAFADREFVYSRAGCKSDSPEYAALTSAASRYRKSRLVTDILTISQAPLHIMFQGERFKAMQVLADRMQNANYDKDKIAAADALLKHTAPNEKMKIELDVGIGTNSSMQNLTDQLAIMAARQQELLSKGLSLVDVQKIGVSLNIPSDIEEGEIIEHN